MRLTILLLIAATFQVNARTYSQSITLRLSNVPLEKAFDSIEKQSGYSFVYAKSDLTRALPVTLNETNAGLKEVLEKLFSNQPLAYAIRDKFVIVKPKLQQQKSNDAVDLLKDSLMDIHGRLMNEQGEPLAGANVMIKATGKGTTTNARGEFTLRNIAVKDVLVFSFTGYSQQEFTIKSTTSYVNIILKQAVNALDEVIVQAYGSTTKRLTTGSFSTVKAEELEKQPVSNVLAAIEGLVPGLKITQTTGVPGGNFSVQLRGQNSILQNSDPLYVVDGVPYTSSTPSKIGYVSALSTGVSPLDGLNLSDIESITVLKDAAATSIYGARGANGVILITMKKGRKGATKVDVNAYSGWGKDTRRLSLMNTSQYLAMRREAFKNGGTTPTVTTAPDLLVWDTTKYTDWQKYLLGGTAHYNDVQASVSGGSGNTGFLLGAGYHDEGTVYPGNSADRKGSVHFSFNHTSTNGRFKAVMTGSFTHEYLNLPPQDLTSQGYLAPNRPDLLNADGSLNFPAGAINPLTFLKQPYSSTTDNLISHASLSYTILPGLLLKADMGYTDTRSNELQIVPVASFNPATLATRTSYSYFGNSRYKIWNIEPQLTYNRHWGRNTLSVLVGTTIESSFNTGTAINASTFPNDALLSNMQAAKTLTFLSNTNTNTKYNSLFGRISYNRDEKYIMELTARRDGSSRFGPGRQFGNFGAAGLGWVFTKEGLFHHLLKAVNFGKLRASYGTVGNAPGSDYNYLSLWTTTAYAYDTLSNLYPTNLFNQNYAWELTHKLELGVDVEFLQGRIALSADYYRNSSSNQLVSYVLPAITGFTSLTANLPATVQNNGWEFSLRTVNVQRPSFRWTTTFNFSAPRNKLLSFPGLATSSYASRFVIGQPVNITRQLHFVDVDPQTGLYRFQTAAGLANSAASIADYTSNFDVNPRYYGGMDNTFSYKGFTLSVFFYYSKQKGINSFATVPGGISNLPTTYLDHWQKPGDISRNQKISYPLGSVLLPTLYVSQSDYGVTDASFIRLKNLALSYQLPARVLSRAHFTDGKVYLQCQNLWTITNFAGLDPETQSNNAMPPLRVITAGIQLTL